MKGRTVAILAILLVALASTTTFEARQNGIGKGGDGGCSCHGGMTPDTVITVDGLPEVFNASEEYLFTLTISNDKVPPTNPDQNGGFRIISTGTPKTKKSHQLMLSFVRCLNTKSLNPMPD